jgi:hypothetical protein
MTRIVGTLVDCGAEAGIFFDHYADGNLYELRREKGEFLLLLRSEAGKLVTSWAGYKPDCSGGTKTFVKIDAPPSP